MAQALEGREGEFGRRQLEREALADQAGKFILMMRLYWPDDSPPSILDGSWVIPAVREA